MIKNFKKFPNKNSKTTKKLGFQKCDLWLLCGNETNSLIKYCVLKLEWKRADSRRWFWCSYSLFGFHGVGLANIVGRNEAFLVGHQWLCLPPFAMSVDTNGLLRFPWHFCLNVSIRNLVWQRWSPKVVQKRSTADLTSVFCWKEIKHENIASVNVICPLHTPVWRSK